ncbi:MAG: S8 family peptidase [Caulobacteraceae bacterium]|nr:S8 family peptidase [Caulobacteraceae bacterium]
MDKPRTERHLTAADAGAHTFQVIIELNTDFPGGATTARDALLIRYHAGRGDAPTLQTGTRTRAILAPAADLWPELAFGPADEIDERKSLLTETYLFARLTAETIETLQGNPPPTSRICHPIHKIWLDHEVRPFVYVSARTIKCDAARIAFATAGEGVVWAVADTGIDGAHPHFRKHGNLDLPGGLRHYDLTTAHASDDDAETAALVDTDGHGTHVAGIIAGETIAGDVLGEGTAAKRIDRIVVNKVVRAGQDGTATMVEPRGFISGLAPKCKLLSLKVLKGGKSGLASDLIAAIGYIQQANSYGRAVKIDGVNLSLGYPFEAQWFAAGQSPLCVEVNRLVRCGVVVVVAAGNAGYGRVTTQQGTSESAALLSTVADPGNAELAITVGSTHRDMPHVYGISYFSAKGPTADGRVKPDIVAPGERIVSCAANDPSGPGVAAFKEDSGTSMAAPHVSGAIAGFLSVRQEYKSRPEDLKAIFLATATDLKRRPEFQGAGLLDLMRALQSV